MIPIDLIHVTALELMSKAAIDIPDDYLRGLERIAEVEDGELSSFVLQAMLENYRAAKQDRRAMCGDTGCPRWYVKMGNEARIEGGPVALETALRRATAEATNRVPLRPNRVHPLWRTDHDNNVGINAPEIEYAFEPGGGWIDLIFQRFIEIWSGMPRLLLLIIMASIITPSFWWLLGLLLLFQWTSLVDVVRAEFLRARNFDYIRAARALGVGDATIMRRHVLPNAMVATMTFLPFILSGSIVALTSLDFLGFGLPPGSPSLGELLAQGKANLQAPWLGITAFLVLAVMLSLLVFVGEAVRDAFDPRKTFRS